MKFSSRNNACRQLGANSNTAEIRSKRGFCLIDCIFGKPKSGKRYLTYDIVKGIIGNRLVQGYGYLEACNIVFYDAEVVMENSTLEKIDKFKEVVGMSNCEDTVTVFSLYLTVFEGYLDYTKLARMVREYGKFK